MRVEAILLFLLGMMATLGVSAEEPFIRWSYRIGIFLVAAGLSLAGKIQGRAFSVGWIALLGISVWGFGQLALGATEYRWATLEASLETACYGATALVARAALMRRGVRRKFLGALVWFGLAVSVVSVLTHVNSPGKVLWLFPSPYPDTWGPFLSRNTFAQFLEITLPVALWLSIAEDHRFALWSGAAMLAAGLASASRAGVILLLVETILVFLLAGRMGGRSLKAFLPAALILIAVAGAGTLVGRFRDPDPLRFRKEIFQSTVTMIGTRPWTGYGLGNYAAVYPEFAAFDAGAVVEHAHNDWLERAAEGGLPYLALWLLLAVRVWVPCIRSIWGMGVAALFLHSLVDFPFARQGIAVWAFVLIGALLPRAAKRLRAREASAPEH